MNLIVPFVVDRKKNAGVNLITRSHVVNLSPSNIPTRVCDSYSLAAAQKLLYTEQRIRNAFLKVPISTRNYHPVPCPETDIPTVPLNLSQDRPQLCHLHSTIQRRSPEPTQSAEKILRKTAGTFPWWVVEPRRSCTSILGWSVAEAGVLASEATIVDTV